MRRMEPQRIIEMPEVKIPDVQVTLPDINFPDMNLPDFPNPMPTVVQQVTIDKRLLIALYVQLGLLNLGILTGLAFFIWSVLQ